MSSQINANYNNLPSYTPATAVYTPSVPRFPLIDTLANEFNSYTPVKDVRKEYLNLDTAPLQIKMDAAICAYLSSEVYVTNTYLADFNTRYLGVANAASIE